MIFDYSTKETRCGGADCPWLIEAGRGQKIHLTIYDFNITRLSKGNIDNPICTVYAVLKEVRNIFKSYIKAKSKAYGLQGSGFTGIF